MKEFNEMSLKEEEKLYASFSHLEKLQICKEQKDEFSTAKRPAFNIWRNIYTYIAELDRWILTFSANTWRAEHSFNPETVEILDQDGSIEYIYHVESQDIFKRYVNS